MRMALIVLLFVVADTEAEAQDPVRLGRTRQLVPPVGASAGAASDMNGDGLDDLVLAGGTTRL